MRSAAWKNGGNRFQKKYMKGQNLQGLCGRSRGEGIKRKDLSKDSVDATNHLLRCRSL